MKYPKEYLDEIKTRLKVSTVVSKSVSLKKMIKQRSESIEVYKKNNRVDLLEIEENEVNVLSVYLPKQLSEEETRNICKQIIEKTEANSIKEMGKVMGELKKNHSESVDFSIAGKIIKQILNT